MPLSSFINNSYKLVSSDNLDAYLEAMEVAAPVKDVILKANTTVTLTENGGVYTVKTKSTMRDHDITFTPGVEFEDVGIDGRNYRSVINIDGNKMIHDILGNIKSRVLTEFTDDKLTVTFTTGSVKATQVLERV